MFIDRLCNMIIDATKSISLTNSGNFVYILLICSNELFLLLVNLCKVIIPIYIGCSRALGCFPNPTDETPLFLLLFPLQQNTISNDKIKEEYDDTKVHQTKIPPSKSHQYLSLMQKIPRSHSTNLSASNTFLGGLNANESGTDLVSLSSFSSINYQRPSITNSNSSSPNIPQREARYLFFKFGSNFESIKKSQLILENDCSKNNVIEVPIADLEVCLEIAKGLLSQDVLNKLDKIASEVYSVSFYHNVFKLI